MHVFMHFQKVIKVLYLIISTVLEYTYTLFTPKGLSLPPGMRWLA